MQKEKMTASQAASLAGFTSLTELSECVDVSRRTLINWFHRYPERFKAVLLGGMVVRGQKISYIKDIKEVLS